MHGTMSLRCTYCGEGISGESRLTHYVPVANGVGKAFVRAHDSSSPNSRGRDCWAASGQAEHEIVGVGDGVS